MVAFVAIKPSWLWLRNLAKIEIVGAVVVVKWSVLSPIAPKIRVRILLSTKYLYEKTTINEKEAGVGPFKKALYLTFG